MVCTGAECFTSACEVRDIFTLNFYTRDVIKMGPRGSQIVEYGIIPFQKNKDIPTSRVRYGVIFRNFISILLSIFFMPLNRVLNYSSMANNIIEYTFLKSIINEIKKNSKVMSIIVISFNNVVFLTRSYSF
jgi:hypothetical protein